MKITGRNALKLFSMQLVFIALSSCGLIYITDTSGIITNPSEYNQVLDAGEQISVAFNFEVERHYAESIFELKHGSDSTPGYISWTGNTMRFVPVPGLVCGRRYLMKCSGVVKDTQAHSYRLNYEIPFYYQSDTEKPPAVLGITPANGAKTGRLCRIVIRFSKAMDSVSFRSEFSLTPDTGCDIFWDSSQTQATITPKEAWENLSLYTLTVSEETADTLGIPMTEAYTSTFIIEEDTSNPGVLFVGPAYRDWESNPPFPAVPGGLSLDYILYDQAIRIEFSEPMDEIATKSAFSISPPLAGQLAFVADATLVFVPQAGYVMGTLYTLTISRSAEDPTGSTMLADYVLRFRADIPAMEVSSIEIENQAPPIVFTGPYSTDVPVDFDVSANPIAYDCTFRLTFSEPVDNGNKEAAQKAVNIECVFPPAYSSPVLHNASWIGDYELEVTYAGFKTKTSLQEYYYIIEVRGEEAGVRNNSGSFMESDVKQLLRTE